MTAPRLDVREVDRDRWPDLVRLFGGRGGPKSCWCMVWRATPQEAKQTDGASRKRALQARVRNGVPIGLLGYADGEPVAWCSIAPRETYRRLAHVPAKACPRPDRGWTPVRRQEHARLNESRACPDSKGTGQALGGPDDHDAVGVWSLACFFIRRDLRRQGIAAQLIEAAVAHARARGATVVEAYPVDPDSPSYRFMGFVDTFCRAGFREVGRAGKRRNVMRLDLR